MREHLHPSEEEQDGGKLQYDHMLVDLMTSSFTAKDKPREEEIQRGFRYLRRYENGYGLW
jgi:hypothetical protein